MGKSRNTGRLSSDNILSVSTTNPYVGIGTTNPQVALDVAGGVRVSGLSTLGVTSATNLTAQQLNVSGVSTFAGISTFQSTLFGTQASFSGIVTATGGFNIGIQSSGVDVATGVVTALNFIGAGNTFAYNSANKTVDINISGGVSISTNTTNQSQYITYVTGTGTTSGFGVTTGLTFNPSSGNLGIGTASPAFKADIAGDARITSTNKMRFGGNAGTSNFYIQYNSTTNSLDFVAG